MIRRVLVGLVMALLVASFYPQTASSQGPVNLTFWSWRVEDKEAYDRIIRVFEQRNPGIKVEFVPFKATEYNTILSTALTAGKGPDIIHLRAYGGLETFTAPGYIAPLSFETVPGLRTFSRQILEGASGRKRRQDLGSPVRQPVAGHFLQ